MNNRQIEVGMTDRIDELRFHPISKKYRMVQISAAIITYAIFAGLALLLLLTDTRWTCVAAEIAIIISLGINLIILRKAYRFKGYALREHDLTWRSGVVFPKITTIPFSRIQQVSISQTPVSRFFKLYAIEIVNGAQNLSSIDIEGLDKNEAENIRYVVTQKMNGND